MELDAYIMKGGQKLRLGYTTGSCAAAAAKAAAAMLLTGQRIPQVRLNTPKGLELFLDIEDIRIFPSSVSCAVRKDSGDDPDITNHALIYAEVALSAIPGIRIDGGEGVGRVTKPGLDQPVGSAAINSTPRRMIEEAVREAAREHGMHFEEDKTGFDVTIRVPRGRELAAKTFNPKLGIEGGISILGTSGIVEPMSDQALLDTIRVEISVRRKEGLSILPAAPGNYGKNYFLEKYRFSLETAVTASNFIYDTVLMAAEAGFTRMLFVGHIGKLIKVAGGIRNTHSQYGDRRMEILTQITEDILRRQACETDISSQTAEEEPAPSIGNSDRMPREKSRCLQAAEEEAALSVEELRRQLSACVMTDEAVRILQNYGLGDSVMAEMTRRIQAVMQSWTQGKLHVEVIVFSNVHGELGKTAGAEEYMQILKKELPR